ncbi:MAG: autotransporter assembly complex protein TamA [Immundisolibacter sp.]|uniref:autotransporter assembly complex protein TamA n=1 Tax=Immundisolibacter sp. TaxID=1934948 RepID=UPI003EE11541
MIRGLRGLRRALVGACLLLMAPLALAASPAVQVELDGLSDSLRDSVLASLDISAEAARKRVSVSRLRRAHAAAPRQIAIALEASGYYRSQTHATLTRADTGWRAHYQVQRGPPLRISQLQLTVAGPAQADLELQAARPKFPLKVGDRLRHARYDSGKRALLETLLGYGYFDARYTLHRVDVDPEVYEARVLLTLDSGPRYRFGAVALDDTVVNEPLLRRYGAPQAGTPYHAADLLSYQGSLSDSGYFSGVDVTPGVPDRQAGTVPIQVSLTARPRNAYSAGAGFATDSGPRLRAGHERRYVNQRGHSLDSHLLLSPRDSTLGTTYRIPLADPRAEQLTFGAALSQKDTVTARSDSLNLQSVYIRRQGPWRRTLGLDYLIESFRAGDDRGNSKLLIPSVSWLGSRSDDPLWPRDGGRLEFTLRGALAGLLSDLSFAQARVGGKYVAGFGRNQRLLGRVEVGSTWVDGFGELPTSLRFFAGGDQSVRGFDYQKLGPRDSSGDVAGGRHLLVASLEYEWMFAGDFGGALFFDAGNAFDGVRLNLKRGAGFGVRWRSPIGAVRVDIASAVSEPGAPLRLHLSVGPDL